MRLSLKTAPTAEPITLQEAKNHLRVDLDDDDSLITSLITTARQLAERETHRALITQTWQMYLDEAPAEVEIPKPPLQSIVAITVVDTEGTETVVNSDLYYVDTSQNSLGRVKLKDGVTWPEHRYFASFIVEFKAGYGDAATDVPEALKQATLQVIAHLYENRGVAEIPKGLRMAFWPFRVWRI